MNRHLKNLDKKFFDEFHNVNAHVHLLMTSVTGEIDGKNSVGIYNDNALALNVV